MCTSRHFFLFSYSSESIRILVSGGEAAEAACSTGGGRAGGSFCHEPAAHAGEMAHPGLQTSRRLPLLHGCRWLIASSTKTVTGCESQSQAGRDKSMCCNSSLSLRRARTDVVGLVLVLTAREIRERDACSLGGLWLQDCGASTSVSLLT